MYRRLLYSLGAIILIGIVAGTIIAYGKGKRIDFRSKSLTNTGILSANSSPDAASIFLDSKLVSATNTSLNLSPGWYQVKITKEGYQSWEKKIRIQGEIVSKIDALLLSNNPSLRPLTATGAISTSLSPTKSRAAYIVIDKETTPSSQVKSKTGIYTIDLKSAPLGGRNSPKQILSSSQIVAFNRSATSYFSRPDWQNTRLYWSPDEKQMIVLFITREKNKDKTVGAFQISTDANNIFPQDVLFTHENLIHDWEKTAKQEKDDFVVLLPIPLSNLLSQNADEIKFSPDETKVFYLATSSATLSPVSTPSIIGSNSTKEDRQIAPGKYYIYDLKEDKNFLVSDKKTNPSADSLVWFYDSKHIIVIEKDTISIMDYDGTNKRTVYSGPFEDNIVFSYAGDGKIVILTNLNKPSSPGNLYEIDLR